MSDNLNMSDIGFISDIPSCLNVHIMLSASNLTRVTRVVLVVAALLDVVPGLVHCFAADGGAGSIAGIVLAWPNATAISVGGRVWDASDYHRMTVLVLFSALGQTQMKMGIVTALAALGLEQGRELYCLTLALGVFQLYAVIMSASGYRNIHLVATSAPGGYKSYGVFALLAIAAISQVIWYHNHDKNV